MADALLQMFVLVTTDGLEKDVADVYRYLDVNTGIVKPRHFNAFVMTITYGVERFVINVSIIILG